MNALKTSIDAQLPCCRAKILPRSRPHRRALRLWNLANPVERDLVDTLIRTSWLLRRLSRIEDEIWQDHWERTSTFRSKHPVGAWTGDKFFERPQSRVNACRRNYQKALK
jgi:hypothetical protein